VTKFLKGFDARDVILGAIVFYIIALTINLGTFELTRFGVFTKIESHFDITRGTTIQSIAVKVDSLINKQSFSDVDIQLTCSKQLCTVSFYSEGSRDMARWAKRQFDTLNTSPY